MRPWSSVTSTASVILTLVRRLSSLRPFLLVFGLTITVPAPSWVREWLATTVRPVIRRA